MQINNAGKTLLDYLDNRNKSSEALGHAAHGQNHRDIFVELKAVEQSVAENNLDSTFALVDDLENSVSAQTIDNMIAFKGRKVEERLSDIAEGLGVAQEVKVQLDEGAWKVVDSPELSEKQSDYINNYLQADRRLNSELTQLNRLSKVYEFSQIKEEAAKLKSEDEPESNIIDFLKNSRQSIFENDVIRFSKSSFEIGSRGLAASLIDVYKQPEIKS